MAIRRTLAEFSDDIATADIADNSITLAKMAGGTDGQIITYDASGDPVAVGPGADGQALTSTGAGSPPAFETIPSFDTDAAQVFNESGADVDFRIESDDNVNMFFVNGGDDRVGIGTNAPGALLDVRGPVGTGATCAGLLRLSTAELTIVDADQLGRIEFIAPLESSGTDAIVVGASIYAEANDTFATDNNQTDLVFATGESGDPTEECRITSDGILLFPKNGGYYSGGSLSGGENTEAIRINWNTINAAIYCYSNHSTPAPDNRGIVVNYDYLADATGAHYFTTMDANGVIGRIEAGSATTTSYVTVSDERAKKDITDYTGGLELLNKFKVRNFTWRKNDLPSVGFIAQELGVHGIEGVVSVGSDIWYGDLDENDEEVDKEKVLPWATDLGKLVPTLVSAIQELSAKVATLEAIQDDSSSSNAALEARIIALENA